jgi:hypothetical protein
VSGFDSFVELPVVLSAAVRFNDLQKYQAWLVCDRVTRETRRLVKLIAINDFTGMPMRRPPSAWMNSFAESSKTAEKVFPQLVETNAMVNCPSWFNWIFAIVRLFLSKKTLDKMKRCGGDAKRGDIGDCPFVRSHLSPTTVPSYLGGSCECPRGCVPGTPNCVTHPLPRKPSDEEVAALMRHVVAKRAEEERDLAAYLAQQK